MDRETLNGSRDLAISCNLSIKLSSWLGRATIGFEMTRFTAKALLLVLMWAFFAPLAAAFTPVPPHACCLRKTAHCHDHSQMGGMQMGSSAMGQMDMGGSTGASSESAPTASFRAPNCCQQGGCCCGLSTGAFALNVGSPSQNARIVTFLVSPQQDSPRTLASATLHEVRGPPAR